MAGPPRPSSNAPPRPRSDEPGTLDAVATGDQWTPEVALALATALHLGFQGVVTLLVYPALAEVGPDAWARAHQRHSTRITPIVGLVYGLLLAACAVRLGDPLDAGTWVAYLGSALALATTAFAAAPTHGRLGSEPDPGARAPLVRRLLVVDRVRLAGTVLACAGALAALGGV